MRGLVLAAGRGSRLGKATADRPKALVEVWGRTLLDRQVRALRHAGATEVGCVIGWRAEAFQNVLGIDRIFTNREWGTTSMVESLMRADDWLRDDLCLVSYGDIVFSGRDALALAHCGADVAIAQDPRWLEVWSQRFSDPLADAETFSVDENGWVTEIGGRPRDLGQVQGQFVGLLLFSPRGWSVTRELALRTRPRDTTGLLGALVATGAARVRSVPLRDAWWEFDHADDLDLGSEVVDELDRLELDAGHGSVEGEHA